MAKIFYVIGRQEIFYSGTLKQCRELLKDCYENYPDHIDMIIAEHKESAVNIR